MNESRGPAIGSAGRRRLAVGTTAAAAVLGFCLPAAAATLKAGWSGLRIGGLVAPPRGSARLARKPATSPPAPPRTEEPGTEDAFNECKRPPPGKPVVPVPLKPDTDVAHLIRWISSITCQAFVWSTTQALGNRHVTIVAPVAVTANQAFRLFLDAMNSIGLTVQPCGGFFQVIEASRAKSKPIPVYDWDGHRIAGPRS